MTCRSDHCCCPNFNTPRLRSCCCFVCRNKDHKAKDVGHDQSGAVGRKDGCQNKAQTLDGWGRGMRIYNCDFCFQKLGNGHIYKALDSLEMEDIEVTGWNFGGHMGHSSIYPYQALPLGTRT